jgi:hypothetical protein
MIHSIGQLAGIERDDYTLVIVNPGFSGHSLAKVRTKFPDADLYVTVNAHSVPLWGEGVYTLDALRHETMDCLVPTGESLRYASAKANGTTALLDMSMEAAEELANWAVGLIGFDGLYIDELWGPVPAWFADAAGPWVDLARWAAYRDHLLHTLEEWAPGPVIANTAGYIPDRGDLAGITIEAGHGSPVELLPKFHRASSLGLTQNVCWGHEMNGPGVVMPGDRAE